MFVAANMVFIILILLGATMALMTELGMMGLPWWMAKREKSFRKMIKRAEQRGEQYVPPSSYLALVFAGENELMM